jgi:putative ABC transport system permease protein
VDFLLGSVLVSDKVAEDKGYQLDSLVLVKRAKGVPDAAARAAVAPILQQFPAAELQSQEGFKKQVASQIDSALIFVVILLLLAVFIALIGIVHTLALSIFERTRERLLRLGGGVGHG